MIKRLMSAAAVIVWLSAGSASAAPPSNADRMKACAAEWNAMKAAGKTQGRDYRAFTQQCLQGGAGGKTGAPATASPPKGATGQCRDGSYTKAQTRSGACAGHGGVAEWF